MTHNGTIRPRIIWMIVLVLGCNVSHNQVPDDDDSGMPSRDGSTPADLTSCEEPSDCVLASVTCCGVCGQPSLSDVIAIRTDRAGDYSSELCGDNPICPACASTLNPNLIATCIEETCTAIDVAAHAASECSVPADCQIRVPDCCPCGADVSEYRLISISASAAFESLVCDSDSACPECEPAYPDHVVTGCNDLGHCTVEIND